MRFRPIWCLSFALLTSAGLTFASLCMAEDNILELMVPPPNTDAAKTPVATAADIPAPPTKATDAAAATAAEIPAPPAKASDAVAPEVKAPEAAVPVAKAPEATVPEVKAPETTAPVAKAPEVQAPEPQVNAGDQLKNYKDALAAYRHREYATAKKILTDVVAGSNNDNLTANCLCLIAASDIGMGEYDDCLKNIQTVTKDYYQTSAVQKGYVNHFATYIINQISKVPTTWDYQRWEDGKTDDGKPQYKESVPLGTHIVRVDFKLAFGLYRCMEKISPDAPETAVAKKQLTTLLMTPITFVWVDEKVQLSKKGHPVDFMAKISLKEKKRFSEIICERIFQNWKTDKMYQCLNYYDEVRNLKHRYTALGNGPGGTITLAKVFYFAGYDPFSGNSFNPTESSFGAYLGL